MINKSIRRVVVPTAMTEKTKTQINTVTHSAFIEHERQK